MADNASQNLLKADEDPPVERVLVWACYGLSQGWVDHRLAPLCERHHRHLTPGEFPESLQALEQGEGDWDILFLGQPSFEKSATNSLEFMARRLSRVRPLECLVAVGPAASLENQMALLRAGATDYISMDAESEQIERALTRVIAIGQARRAQSDQDKLQVVSQLAVSVNHEINNPLTGLMGTAELMLLEETGLTEKTRQDLRTILQQCHRIQEVTARLKTLNHLRTIPYGAHDRMLDLIGEIQPVPAAPAASEPRDLFMSTPRLLVVDDNPLIIDLVVRLFEERFMIDAASCASEALDKMGRADYDLVLIDLILPEMNGLELFRAIRRRRPRQKVLLTTAFEGDARVEQAIAEGAAGCIYKPFQLEDLESILADVLKPKRP
jgi:DNA-binding NarL/FixJ family response regulator